MRAILNVMVLPLCEPIAVTPGIGENPIVPLKVLTAQSMKRSEPAKGKRKPRSSRVSRIDPIDVQVGARIRMRRSMLGLSQTKLGECLGLSFQQVQKYECGVNRISASYLLETARFLKVPLEFFYDDTDPVLAPAIPEGLNIAEAADVTRDPEVIELVSAYYDIMNQVVRRRLFQVAKALAEEIWSIPTQPQKGCT